VTSAAGASASEVSRASGSRDDLVLAAVLASPALSWLASALEIDSHLDAQGVVPMLTVLWNVSLQPNVSDLPGGAVLQQLTNGLGGWALALALVGLLIGAALWALGAHSQNYQQSYTGRRAVLVCAAAALVIGAAPALVNFFFHAGQGF